MDVLNSFNPGIQLSHTPLIILMKCLTIVTFAKLLYFEYPFSVSSVSSLCLKCSLNSANY